MYTDKTLTCRDCGQTFAFTAGEQEFFASRGFQNDPSRCTSCRAARSQSGGSGYSGGGYEPRERQMFPAVCSDCGKDTQVPFQPRTDRPVYCSDCFETHRPRADASRGARW
ncbi:MAG: zinc-ribbon domain containing protein [Chloroflexi bacterium]|nr:zinc-ribbon domain containing protein [Chloroflexota bacterium]